MSLTKSILMAVLALLTAAVVIAGYIAVPANAGTPQRHAASEIAQSRINGHTIELVQNFVTPGKGARKKCNGQTTSECCAGISYCGCFYMPGSDNNHPTSCHSSPPSGN
ncbi:MAG: hypothetical protein NW216_11175 [Hyphomicrobium sp.]|nr:hypothetical protein [Hyphomicrobium sp.]